MGESGQAIDRPRSPPDRPQGQGNPDSPYGSIAPKTGQATRSGFEWR
ncbi:hypothetical protein H6G52_07240 [Limnothrix sp. FACHB-881]|nr:MULTISPECIES: hypothetical protein [unclassified Limnothrix]MBD2555163.1 hypothetical protein [Limnothrix sp. FACHB-708]MBD2592589.1 hypothetical protein [Limnothrix sp. FACHB-406]MBD2635148.1 hypothetical protein [Limnothrix sp. FACHB-881]